ncbi:MAG: class I SAM-dependent methyltransferase [Betaproteobacteria bacterium]|nr:class I SAM-dependent methyltransferase [Betaproteobacteria bacterium]MBA3776843.1 class I SAM-dependent methyltransferase [Betaproteobacteria bacterium]
MSYVWQTHLRDEVSFDPVYHQNPRTEIASFINDPPGVVLDIGCGGGATGKLIKEKFPGTRVIGIESNPYAAEHARQYLDDVLCASIEDVDLAEHVSDVELGTVLLLDVLEHLYDPWRALTRIRDWLVPDTRILASVPNIRNLAHLDELAAGRWTYGPNGVLDITHVRFFTKQTLRQLFEETGYAVLHMEPLTQPKWVDRHVVARHPGRLQTQHLSIAFRDFDDLEDLYAFQYVVDARVAETGVLPSPAGR